MAAIDRQLGSGAPDEQRLNALKYLVDFVGDVHEPLHAGYQDDRGRYQYQLQAFMRVSNPHAVWDTVLIKAIGEDVDAMEASLAGKGAAGQWTAVQAAEESCRIFGRPGFYPGMLVDGYYVAQWTPVIEGRLNLAGARLAEVQNRVLQ